MHGLRGICVSWPRACIGWISDVQKGSERDRDTERERERKNLLINFQSNLASVLTFIVIILLPLGAHLYLSSWDHFYWAGVTDRALLVAGISVF